MSSERAELACLLIAYFLTCLHTLVSSSKPPLLACWLSCLSLALLACWLALFLSLNHPCLLDFFYFFQDTESFKRIYFHLTQYFISTLFHFTSFHKTGHEFFQLPINFFTSYNQQVVFSSNISTFTFSTAFSLSVLNVS